MNTEIITYLNKIKQINKFQNLELIESYVDSDNLYEINSNISDYNKKRYLYRHYYNIEHNNKSNATFYQGADLGQIADVVRFFHETFCQPSRELMCWIVKNQVFKNIPPISTERAIRKYFPDVRIVLLPIWPSRICLDHPLRRDS